MSWITRRKWMILLVGVLATVMIAAVACGGEEEAKAAPTPDAPALPALAATAMPAEEAAPAAEAMPAATAKPAEEAAPAAEAMPAATAMPAVEVVKPVPTAVPVPPAKVAPPKILRLEDFPATPDILTQLKQTNMHTFVYDGPRPTTFQEAPELAELVKAGKLPKLLDRLPVLADIKYVNPVESIGQYGGIWRRVFKGPVDDQNLERPMADHLIYFDADAITVVPKLAKGWSISDDLTTYTYFLREGLKWSDGAPLTSEDFIFAWEDIALNKEILPQPAGAMNTDPLPIVTAPDKYTIVYQFPEAYGQFLNNSAAVILAGWYTNGIERPGTLWAPKHYLKQFHPAYVGEAKALELAKADGYENWVQNITRKGDPHENVDVPVNIPFMLTSPNTTQLWAMTRNPYYYGVDPEGNQLPYIDGIEAINVEDWEIATLKAIAGEITFHGRGINLDKVPVLLENADRGGYRIIFCPAGGGSENMLYFNQTVDIDEWRNKYLKNVKFRQAMSMALNRQEAIDTLRLGLQPVRNAIPKPTHPYYPGADYETKYAEYDPARANALLDEIGLTEKDGEGYRLDPETGNRLFFSNGMRPDLVPLGELMTGYWDDVGIKVNISVEEYGHWAEKRNSNQHELSMWACCGDDPWGGFQQAMPINNYFAQGILWGKHYVTDGEEGVQGPPDILRLQELFDKGKKLLWADPQRVAWGKEVYQILTDNVWGVSTFTTAGGVFVVDNHFRNIPMGAPASPGWSCGGSGNQTPGHARPSQWFFAQ
jgi:peptide/nickel transport system substrate-binding protein